MIKVIIPEKLELNLPDEEAQKLYNFLRDQNLDKVAVSNDWGMDLIAFRTPKHDVVFYVPSHEGYKFVELDTFEEIMLRDLLSFALAKREVIP